MVRFNLATHSPLLSSLNDPILGSPKQQKVPEEVYSSGFSSTGARGREHENSRSSPKGLEARAKDGLPHRVLILSTPSSHRETPSEVSSSIEDTGLDVQVVHSIPTSPSPFVDATLSRRQPWLPVADNGIHPHPLASGITRSSLFQL